MNRGIIFLGDIAFSGLISQQTEKNKMRYSEVIPIFKEADLVFANLEVPVKVDDTLNEYKDIIHESLPYPTAEMLRMLNIRCVSLANNHIYDRKMSGLQATIMLLDKLGIYHTGAGWLPAHIEPVIIKQNGLNIAFIAYVDQSTNPKAENFPELLINYFELGKVIRDIKKVREISDKLIVSLHWGVDYSYYPTEQQIREARLLIDSGADIIMGHHPHTLQPFEKYKTGYIFYSLGGLTFGDYKKTENGPLLALYKKTKKGLIAIFDAESNEFKYISTVEKIGNYIKIIRNDYIKWSNRKWVLLKFKYSSSIAKSLFNFKENVIDRVYEYFCGYYQHPLKRALQIGNIKKIGKLFKNTNQD